MFGRARGPPWVSTMFLKSKVSVETIFLHANIMPKLFQSSYI